MGCLAQCAYGYNLCCLECEEYETCGSKCDDLDKYENTANCPNYTNEYDRVHDAVSRPAFWRHWNLQEGKEFRKAVLDLLEENQHLKMQIRRMKRGIEYGKK